MVFQLPFGHPDARVDSRTPRETTAKAALEINRRVRRLEARNR
jgi:hypothetical protein